MLDGYRTWLSFFDEDRRRATLPDADEWAVVDYAERWRITAGADPLDRLLALNIATYLLDDLLVKADRMSMAHGLEVRSPFLDTELLRACLQASAAAEVFWWAAQACPGTRRSRSPPTRNRYASQARIWRPARRLVPHPATRLRDRCSPGSRDPSQAVSAAGNH